MSGANVVNNKTLDHHLFAQRPGSKHYVLDSADILFYSILPISLMYEKTLFLRDKNQPISERLEEEMERALDNSIYLPHSVGFFVFVCTILLETMREYKRERF